MRSFISWVGGKSKLVKTIVDQFPPHKVYVEVFGGAAWVLFEKSPGNSEVEIYNDINGDLVNLFRVVKAMPAAFTEKFNYLLYSRQVLNDFWKSIKEGVPDELDRAVKFYFCVRSSFGSKPGGGWGFSKKSRPRSILNFEHLQAASARLASVYVEHSDFRKLIPLWDSPDTLFYLDPPYLMEEKMYAFDFQESDHADLRQIIDNIKGKVVLSYNDSPAVRKLYKGFEILSTKQVHYCMNNKRSMSRKKSELVIRNF